ncbi:MAG: hypothetical protein JSS49_23725 [Planctomycetes bacterium]|nr:hypothetical protein [Planctomycetota bacterium]
MRREPLRIFRGCAAWMAACLIFVVQGSAGAQPPEIEPVRIAERPWMTFWISSLARTLAACDIVYDSIDRGELSESLEERLQFSEFQGIDRSRPLGMMYSWDDKQSVQSFFIPVQQIDNLMKTATFGVVGYHKVKEDQFEIERPGVPYHVVVRSGYALFGEDVAALNALRESPERVTKELRDKYDAAFVLDQRQMPRDSRQRLIEETRGQFEPWLQKQDDEPIESAAVRRAIGKMLLDAFELLIEDVQTVTVGVRIDRRTYQLKLELVVQAEPGSSMAAELNRLVVQRSNFSALVNRDASAGLAINWPLTLLGKDVPALGGNKISGGRLDLGVQLVGSDWSDMTLIAGIRGPEAAALNAAIPHFLTRMEKSVEFTSVQRNVGNYRNVDLHQVVPARVPDLLQSILPTGLEMIIGQGKQTVWLAAGPPDALTERLYAAVDAVEDASADERAGAVMQGRLSVGKWPSVLPLVDPQEAREVLQKSKDGFSMSLQPIRNGMKIELSAEEGLLRVIGRHWAGQLDREAAARSN